MGLAEHVGDDGRFVGHRLGVIRQELRELTPSLEAFVEANRLVTVTLARGGQAWPVIRRLSEALEDEDEEPVASASPAVEPDAKKRSATLSVLMAGARAMLIGGLAKALYDLLRSEKSVAEDAIRTGLALGPEGLGQEPDIDERGFSERLAQLLRPWYERTAYGMSSLLADQAGLTDHRLTDQAVRALLKVSGADIAGIVAETRARVQKVLANAWLNNWNFQRAVVALESSGAFSEARARTIARTEIAKASNLAAAWVYGQSPEVEAVLISDGDYDEACAERNGQVVSVKAAADVELLHPNCTLQLHPIYASGRLAEAARATGLVAAGLVVLARDTGRVLLIQRSLADPDDPAAGDWEFPGGHIEDEETSLDAAIREWCEEVGAALPAGEVVDSWVQPNGIYEVFVYAVAHEADVAINLDHEDRHVLNPDDPDGDEIEVAAWWEPEDLPDMPALRAEVKSTPWKRLLRTGRGANDRAVA